MATVERGDGIELSLAFGGGRRDRRVLRQASDEQREEAGLSARRTS